jgi:uncharacterized peroxidase-related enzyme
MTHTLSFPANNTQQLYLPDVRSQQEDGLYKDMIRTARENGTEYAQIWDLFAFRESFTVHLARFTQGVLRTPASIDPATRELIAALTSFQNECRFCTQAHAAAASELCGDESLVWSVLTNLESSPVDARTKTLLRFTTKITKSLAGVNRDDVEEVRAAGWDDEAIYYAITTCALFNFYNRWITATGVPEMSAEAHLLQGQHLGRRGYIREESK